MARMMGGVSKGNKITDYISLGVISQTFPLEKVNRILENTGKLSQRQRDLPAHVVVYYVIALGLFMQLSYCEVLRSLLEGLTWMHLPVAKLKITGKSGISQARTRLGSVPLKTLHDEIVQPIAKEDTKGAWYHRWRLVSMDGSTLETADNRENEMAFGRQENGQGKCGYPQIRFVSLVENGTHVMFGTEMADYHTGESTLAKKVVPCLKTGMLCLADRNFFSYHLWRQAQATGADLLWRVRKDLILPCIKRLPDGSYLSRIYASPKDRVTDTDGIDVRVIEYHLEGIEDAVEVYRLLTTILDYTQAPASELAALYHERWEIETTLDELKTHLRGSRIQLRSKTPELVRQEFYGLLLTHYAIRGLMHEAALRGKRDPDELSFIHAVRVIRRKLPQFGAIPPSALESVACNSIG
jgi:hypothetical protein